MKLRDRYVLYRFIVYIANRNEFLLVGEGKIMSVGTEWIRWNYVPSICNKATFAEALFVSPKIDAH